MPDLTLKDISESVQPIVSQGMPIQQDPLSQGNDFLTKLNMLLNSINQLLQNPLIAKIILARQQNIQSNVKYIYSNPNNEGSENMNMNAENLYNLILQVLEFAVQYKPDMTLKEATTFFKGNKEQIISYIKEKMLK